MAPPTASTLRCPLPAERFLLLVSQATQRLLPGATQITPRFSLTFGTLYLRQSQKAFQTDATISKLKSDVAGTTDQLQQQQQVNSNLEARLRQTRATAVAKAEHAAELEQTMTYKIQAAEAKAR